MADLIILSIIIALILAFSVFKVNLSATLVIATLVLAVCSRFSPPETVRVILNSCVSPDNLGLVLSLSLIVFLSHLFSAADIFQRTISNLERLLKDMRWIMAIIPSVVGFLPMIGGALVSCPIVTQVGGRMNISNEKKFFINYWFRHVWEYTLPIYPGVLMAASVTKQPLSRIIAYNMVFTVGAIAIGIIFGIRKMPRVVSSMHGTSSRKKELASLLFNLSPIFLIVALSLGAGLGAIRSILAGIIYTLIAFHIRPKKILEFKAREGLGIVVIALAIMIFKDMLAATGIIERLPGILKELGISKYIVISALPFLVGFLTGMTVAAIGVPFPVLLPLTGGDPVLTAFSFVCGFSGVLLTPVHVCLAVTREYFKADWKKLYINEIIAPVLLMVAVGIVYVIVF